MRIQSVNNNKNINIESRTEKSKTNFLQNLNKVQTTINKEEIDGYLDDIKKIGERLSSTQNFSDVSLYKKAIKGYLKSVVDYAYTLDKDMSFWEGNYFTTVKTVDEKLEDITRDFLYEQKEKIDIASKVDEINGLLIDLYL